MRYFPVKEREEEIRMEKDRNSMEEISFIWEERVKSNALHENGF